MRIRSVLLLGLFFAFTVPGFTQSLAELAAREAARRAAIKEPARIVTDKDLPDKRAPATSGQAPPAEGTPPAPARPSGEATGTDDNGHDERWWTARAEPLRRKLRDATLKLEAASARARAILAEANRAGTPGRPATIRKREAAEAEVERRAAELFEARRALDDLQDEARKAGALPGWLRK